MDDKIVLRDITKEDISILQIDSLNDSGFSARGENSYISVRITPQKVFVLAELLFDKHYTLLLAREDVMGQFEAVSEELVENKSWADPLESVCIEFKDEVFVESSNDVLKVTIKRDDIPVVCKYNLKSREWHCRAENVEFDWGTMTAEIIPDVEAIMEFFDTF